MNKDSPNDLKWKTVRLPEETRDRLDRATRELNHVLGTRFHLITHPFRKIIACEYGGLLFFHVASGSRPPELLTLAVGTDSTFESFLLLDHPDDFDECCRRLGFHGEEQRNQFRRFLFPQATLRGTARQRVILRHFRHDPGSAQDGGGGSESTGAES